MLAGSFVNIPLYRIRRDMIRATPLDSAGNELAAPFAVPPVWETVISVNLGGGIIPVCIAVYTDIPGSHGYRDNPSHSRCSDALPLSW